MAFDELDLAIRETGTPMVWTYVALETGIHVAYPGKGTYSAEYDPRARPWYQDSLTHVNPTCLPPYEDSMGQGYCCPVRWLFLVIKVKFLGVAGIELSLAQFSQDILGFQSMVVETETMHSLLIVDSGEKYCHVQQ